MRHVPLVAAARSINYSLLSSRSTCSPSILWLDPANHKDLRVHGIANSWSRRSRGACLFNIPECSHDDFVLVAQFLQNGVLFVFRLLNLRCYYTHAYQLEGGASFLVNFDENTHPITE